LSFGGCPRAIGGTLETNSLGANLENCIGA